MDAKVKGQTGLLGYDTIILVGSYLYEDKNWDQAGACLYYNAICDGTYTQIAACDLDADAELYFALPAIS